MPDAYDAGAMRADLRRPFPPEQIGKLPATAKRPELDYVGHAAVTDRLNRVAPDWFYTVDEMFSLGGVCWVRGTMTVIGVSRPEYGDGKDPKEAIGNFIRRGAMRFGVAIDLWSREELEASGGSPSSASSPEKRSSQREAPPEPTSVDGEAPTPADPGGQDAGSDTAPQGTVELATADDLANAAKHGLTPTKAKAIAASLGITVTKATDLTREQLAAVINRYLEVKK